MQFVGKKAPSIIPLYNTDFHEDLHDGILHTEDGYSFKIHRILLIQRSEYFRTMFNFDGINKTDLLMKEIGGPTLQEILHYLYEGALQINEQNVQDVMIASDYLLLDDLMAECREFAIRRMTKSNCLPLLIIASKYERLNIFRECSKYAKVHFEAIVNNFPEKIADLPFEVLTELLNDNSLNVTSEDTVRKAIDIWVKEDPFKRNQHVPDLFKNIRFEEDKSVEAKRPKNAIVISNSFCIESNSFPVAHSPGGPSTSSIPQRILCTETAMRFPKYLHVVVSCRMSQSGMSNEIYLTCDEELDFWRKVGDAPWIPDIIVTIGKYVYLFDTWADVILRYDLLDGYLIPVREMGNHCSYCIVELDKKIYALGGGTVRQNRQPCFQYEQTVKCYDPDSERWNPVKAAGTTIIKTAVAMCGKIYALGRTNNENGTGVNWMQVYDPITDTWNILESPSLFDSRVPAVAFENRLYLVGEGNDLRRKKMNDPVLIWAEEYDPVLDVWTRLPDLPFKYFKPKPLVLAGRLTVFDNYNDVVSDKNRRTVAAAVRWDGVTRTWKITDKLFAFYNSVERYRFRFGILDDPAGVREVVSGGRRSAVQFNRILLSE